MLRNAMNVSDIKLHRKQSPNENLSGKQERQTVMLANGSF